MHLWPTLKIRDSFKQAYLCKLEWNLERIKRSKQPTSSASDQPLLLAASKSQSQEEGPGHSASKLLTDLLAFAGDLLVILTCCLCCRAELLLHGAVS
ncbi:uncharacterized protein LOC103703969 isoform X1 [Phoenix dactylifera]|uniref:Uncharacterized protein LOC103703969 isoform X1 n=1 Tax=Phoenix dactylifera TaxID=42345 RepID=A0A8B9A9L2_PHODC|nr:uncharacterized protein LOC103703969 isoform X1 [Phoenix dactylifera]